MVKALSGSAWKGEVVVSRNVGARRLVAIGALAAAAAVPAVVVTMSAGSAGTGPAEQVAGGKCLAWFGNQEDNKCLGYSNGNGVNVGTPGFVGGNGPNAGWYTGPLLPGTSWNQPIG